MPVYHHLEHVLRIMQIEPDYRNWAPLIEALPEDVRPEVREWLRQEAEKRRASKRYTGAEGRQKSWM